MTAAHAILPPGQLRGLQGIIQAEYWIALLAHHSEKQAATAANIEDRAFLARVVDSPRDKIDVIAQNEAAVYLLQASINRRCRRIPI